MGLDGDSPTRSTAELERSDLPSEEASNTGVVLVFHHGDRDRPVHLESGASLIVGRAFPSQVVLPDPCLSRQHACFRLRDGELFVEDLGSRNGTFLGNRRVESEARVGFGPAR